LLRGGFLMKITKDDVGKPVWDFLYGWGEIANFKSKSLFPVTVDFPRGKYNTYCENGRSWAHCNQQLFWNEIKFQEPPKPKVKVKKSITNYVNIYKHSEKNEYYVSGIYETSEFANSRASWNVISSAIPVTIEFEVDEEE
jgi:hypothetical protein